MTHPAETDVQKIPAEVGRVEMIEALAPLFELLGIHPRAVFDEGGIVIGDGYITVTVAGQVETGASAQPVQVGSDPTTHEWATRVRIGMVPR